MFNDILDNINKETFLHCKMKIFFRVPNSAFLQRVNPWFWSKKTIFSLFVLGQNETRNNV